MMGHFGCMEFSDMWLRSNSAIELRSSSFVTPEAALSSGHILQTFGSSPITPWHQGLWLYFNWFLRNAIWYMTVNAYNGQSHHSTLFYSHFCFTYTWSFIEDLSKENPMAGAQVKLLLLQWFLFLFEVFLILQYWLASQEEFSIKWQ